jgi:hypothetical protein
MLELFSVLLLYACTRFWVGGGGNNIEYGKRRKENDRTDPQTFFPFLSLSFAIFSRSTLGTKEMIMKKLFDSTIYAWRTYAFCSIGMGITIHCRKKHNAKKLYLPFLLS